MKEGDVKGQNDVVSLRSRLGRDWGVVWELGMGLWWELGLGLGLRLRLGFGLGGGHNYFGIELGREVRKLVVWWGR